MREPDSLQLYDDGALYDAQNDWMTDDIPFWLEMAKRTGGPVLELACGTGRVAIPVAKAGFKVTGIELSAPMLEHARHKAASEVVEMNLIEGDVRDFSLTERFGLVIFPFNGIGHLHEHDEIDGCFRCIREHLAPGGRFVLDKFVPSLDILTRDPGLRFPVQEFHDPATGKKVTVTQTSRYNNASQVNRIVWYYKREDGTEEAKELNVRMYYPEELDSLLRSSGFEIEAKYGDYSLSPFGPSSLKQLPVCRAV